jgi:hypothetical protein
VLGHLRQGQRLLGHLFRRLRFADPDVLLLLRLPEEGGGAARCESGWMAGLGFDLLFKNRVEWKRGGGRRWESKATPEFLPLGIPFRLHLPPPGYQISTKLEGNI